MARDPSVFVHTLALCESDEVGPRTRIWAFAHVLAGARIGADCKVGGHSFVEGGVVVGDSVTIKNGVLLLSGVTVEDEVFLGPGAVFTNDVSPRAPFPNGPAGRLGLRVRPDPPPRPGLRLRPRLPAGRRRYPPGTRFDSRTRWVGSIHGHPAAADPAAGRRSPRLAAAQATPPGGAPGRGRPPRRGPRPDRRRPERPAAVAVVPQPVRHPAGRPEPAGAA